MEVRNNKLYCEIANGHSPICSSLPFSFFPDFSSKISPQPFKIETSNLVYRFTTTCCVMELKIGLFLFVLSYISSFFYLSRFLAHLSLLRVSFWDTVMSVVRRTCGRP